ncbi:PE family protein [Mycobacterium kansasii]|uniref:PE family protein n=1 Tax=Mycobacterium kansasii TaxID=1768 RepID=UPI000CDD9787|nr:PE family protein [Mycobacterium kansasii]POY09105.1 PE family protein [Mycobacterium kansasii]POY31742.1 PE family protein [Mycobacterium kansasii]
MTQAGLAARLGAGVAAAEPTLSAVAPMGEDADSAAFTAALAAVGAAYVSTAAEHAAARGVQSDAQSVAAGIAVVSEAMRAAALAL